MTPREPSEADLQAAFALLHGDDWPRDLHTLRMAATRMKLVQAAAREIANGGRPTRPDIAAPITPAPPARPAPRFDQAWPLPAKRQAQGIDMKRLASGDRDD